MKKISLVILLLLMSNFLFAQGEAAVPFLTLPQSPFLNGAGWIGAAIPNDDALGFYYNPAMLGYTSRTNHASFFVMPEKSDWLKKFNLDMTFNTFGFTAGYQFSINDGKLPVSVGIGYIRNVLDYGKANRVVGEGIYLKDSYDSFNCFSVGGSLDYFVLFNAGFSIKPFYSKLSDQPLASLGSSEVSGTAFDVGLMVIAPISKLFFNDYKMPLEGSSYFTPKANFTVGYSLTNLGKEIYYIDPAQADPIPRTARLGYSINLGFDLSIQENIINVVDYSFTVEADDILIKRDTNWNTEYQGIFGDIKPWKNLIQLEGDDDVIVHRGHILKLFETFILTSGRFGGNDYREMRKTSGFGFSSDGIFKLLALATNNSAFEYIAKHFVIDYNEATFFVDSLFETNMSGVSLTYRNFEL
ncbi:MAG: hypothetical protein V1720_06875 [bacterium]